MINVKIYRNKNKDIVKAVFEGHSLFSDENDIVCAAVSAVTHLVLNGIENVVGVSFGYETEDGYLYFVLPEDVSLADREKLNVLLDSMFLFLINLEKQYSDNITIIESEV